MCPVPNKQSMSLKAQAKNDVTDVKCTAPTVKYRSTSIYVYSTNCAINRCNDGPDQLSDLIWSTSAVTRVIIAFVELQMTLMKKWARSDNCCEGKHGVLIKYLST